MNNKNDVAKIVIDHLANEMEIESTEIRLEDSFEILKAKGLNSMFFVKIIVDLEQILNINFEDDKLILDLYETIEDLVDYILEIQKRVLRTKEEK